MFDSHTYLDSPILEHGQAGGKASLAARSSVSRKSVGSKKSKTTSTSVKKEPSKAELLAMLGGSPKKQATPPKTTPFEDNHRIAAQTPDPASSKRPQKYTPETPVDAIRAALVNDGLRQGLKKESVLAKVDKTLSVAQSDASIMKGLLQYLNWQDSQPQRLETPRIEPAPKAKAEAKPIEKPVEKPKEKPAEKPLEKPQELRTATDPKTGLAYAFETDFGTSSAK